MLQPPALASQIASLQRKANGLPRRSHMRASQHLGHTAKHEYSGPLCTKDDRLRRKGTFKDIEGRYHRAILPGTVRAQNAGIRQSYTERLRVLLPGFNKEQSALRDHTAKVFLVEDHGDGLPANSFLQADLNLGDTRLFVGNTYGFDDGDIISISPHSSSDREQAIIHKVQPNFTIMLTNPLKRVHYTGARVERDLTPEEKNAAAEAALAAARQERNDKAAAAAAAAASDDGSAAGGDGSEHGISEDAAPPESDFCIQEDSHSVSGKKKKKTGYVLNHYLPPGLRASHPAAGTCIDRNQLVRMRMGVLLRRMKLEMAALSDTSSGCLGGDALQRSLFQLHAAGQLHNHQLHNAVQPYDLTADGIVEEDIACEHDDADAPPIDFASDVEFMKNFVLPSGGPQQGLGTSQHHRSQRKVFRTKLNSIVTGARTSRHYDRTNHHVRSRGEMKTLTLDY